MSDEDFPELAAPVDEMPPPDLVAAMARCREIAAANWPDSMAPEQRIAAMREWLKDRARRDPTGQTTGIIGGLIDPDVCAFVRLAGWRLQQEQQRFRHAKFVRAVGTYVAKSLGKNIASATRAEVRTAVDAVRVGFVFAELIGSEVALEGTGPADMASSADADALIAAMRRHPQLFRPRGRRTVLRLTFEKSRIVFDET